MLGVEDEVATDVGVEFVQVLYTFKDVLKYLKEVVDRPHHNWKTWWESFVVEKGVSRRRSVEVRVVNREHMVGNRSNSEGET